LNVYRGNNNLIGLEDFPNLALAIGNGLIIHSSLVHIIRLESNATIGCIIGNLSIIWTFCIDIFLIGNEFSYYNMAGGILVGGSAVLIPIMGEGDRIQEEEKILSELNSAVGSQAG
jgi:hypothetical protein